MKRIILSLFIWGLPLFSAPVSIDKAEKVARNWYYEAGSSLIQGMAPDRDKLTQQNLSITNHFVEIEGKDTLFYVFNFDPAGSPDNGFVIVSAEDATVPVLGYNFSHHYSDENHPPQFDDMLRSWESQIIYIRKNRVLATEEIREEWNRLNTSSGVFIKKEGIKAVAPLITTVWDQPYPYNSQCPSIGGEHCLVGCVAVAMAQVMKYHSWPPQGTSSHSYYDYGCQQTVSANFNTNYDWYNMPNSLVGASQTQVDATAKLLFHCGVSVDMSYGLDGSGAGLYEVPSALTSYFKYYSSAQYLSKDYYSDNTWASMMRTEMDNSRPVVYTGSDTAGGHAFVMDGYQGTNYFHFNWGWSGYYDGYYYLNNLNPGGMNFTYSQGAVIGIQLPPGPVLSVLPDTLRFIWDNNGKKLSPQYDTSKTLIARNTGTASINVTSIMSNQSWVTSISPTSFTVAPGDSKLVTVTVSRAGLGDGGIFYDALSIYSNNPKVNPYNEMVKFEVRVKDVSPISYTDPPAGVEVGVPYPVNFAVQNKGYATESFPAKCIILTGALDTGYIQTFNVTSLAPGDSQVVNFPNWTPTLYADTYTVICATYLSGDVFTENDTLVTYSMTYEQGEIAYDDFGAEAYYSVRSGAGGTNGPQDAVGVHFAMVDSPPFYITKGKVFVNDSTHLEYIGLFPGTQSAPNINSPYDKILNPYLETTSPGWLVVNFDTSKTYITNSNVSNPIWLVAKFATGLKQPRVGCDVALPRDSNSCWTKFCSSGVWQPIYSTDFMMRIILKSGTNVEENPVQTTFKLKNLENPVKDNFSIEYILPVKIDVNISLYDISGRLVRTICNGVQKEGSYKIDVKCNDFSQQQSELSSLSDGIYFIKFSAGNFKTTKKLVLLK